MTQAHLDLQLEPSSADLTTQPRFNDSPIIFLETIDQVNAQPSEEIEQREHTTPKNVITVHRQAILLLVVEPGTRKFRCLSVECLFVESGTYDVICQFCTVKGMVVESEVLKAQIAL